MEIWGYDLYGTRASISCGVLPMRHLFGGGGGKKNAGFESWWNEIKEVGEEVILNQNFLKVIRIGNLRG